MNGERKKSRRFFSAVLAMLVAVSYLSVETYAAGKQTQDTSNVVKECREQTVAPDVGLPENEELFAGYVEQMFYGDAGVATYSVGTATAGAKLTGDTKKVYDELISWVAATAAGTNTSSVVTLGETFNYNGSTYVPNIAVSFTGKATDFNLTALVRALLLDCPYEMYWYDKVNGCTMQYGTNGSGDLIYLALKFAVAEDYRSQTNETVIVKTDRVAKAYTEAQRVVEACKDYSDYSMLDAYKNYICEQVTYDSNVSTEDAYGDPWQLINVFDRDNSTNVVCEGYAKAFQYLCDLSTFDNDISCYCVTGELTGGSGAGAHMWNVVKMEDGKNYLVDVTNCDVGYDLFLLGGTLTSKVFGTDSDAVTMNGYEFTFGNATLGYFYDAVNSWGTDVLELAEVKYTPAAQESFSGIAVTPGSGTWMNTAGPETSLFTISASDYAKISGMIAYVSTNAGEDWEQVTFTQNGNVYQSSKTLQDVLGTAVGSVNFQVKLEKDSVVLWTSSTRIAVLSALDLRKDNVEVVADYGSDPFYYTGEPLQPQVKVDVKMNGTIVYNTSSTNVNSLLTVSYENNTAVETGKIIVSGNGQQIVGSKEFDFQILYYQASQAATASVSGWTSGDVTITAPTGYKISRTQNGTYADTITVTNESADSAGTKVTYYLKMDGTGYITDAMTMTIYIDKTVPLFIGENTGIKVTDRGAWWQELLTKMTFGIYGSQKVTIQASDAVSGVQEYYYYLDKEPVAIKTAAELDELTFTKSTDGSFGLDADGNYVIYAYAVDRAGNRSAYISSDGITIDEDIKIIDFEDTGALVSQEELPETVPESLEEVGFQTVEEIKEALLEALENAGVALTGENVAFYEVTLEYSLDGGATWIEATTGNIPEGGVIIRLNYPEGTSKDTHDFVVIHMFGATDSRLGITAGETEQPEVTKAEEYIEVTLQSCSPVCVAWTEIGSENNSGGTDDGISDATGGTGMGGASGTTGGTGTGGASGTTGGTGTGGTSGTSNGTAASGTATNTKGTGTSGTTTTTAGTKVATGDAAQPMWYFVFIVMSILVISVVYVVNRKRRQL